MRYCARCLYPENSKPTIIIDDDDGICSGCKYHESRLSSNINWEERQEIFGEMMKEAKSVAKQRGNNYDCIIPVSGGKDSHFQVYVIKEIYGLNPLLVTYNHIFNHNAGLRNLENLVEKSGCDLIRFTASPHAVKKISRFMLETVGDLTWHYHAGIRTLPFKIAVEKNIPLIVWGEHGFAELTGVVSLEDFVEFTRWNRKEHDMRGFEPEDVVLKSKGLITIQELDPYIFPSDEDIERVDVKGIYMSNFFDWNAKKAVEEMLQKWDFKPISYQRDRTFVQYAKIDDHANDIHDYLKFLKFGYGRATDDASMEIRHGRMTREEGINMVKLYDANTPSSLNTYLEFLEISIEEFYNMVEPMRDLEIWEKKENNWVMKDNVANHLSHEFTHNAKVVQVQDRTLSEKNQHLYYNIQNPPRKLNDDRLDRKQQRFKIL
ncbi:N-acetyl sugar amidotransferase [Flavobacteriaceae bacterium]|nr:N-acetyl sugar amidotransferase [Flavobacteriaceae bacterium]